MIRKPSIVYTQHYRKNYQMSDETVFLVDGLSMYDPKIINKQTVINEKGPLLCDQVKLDMLAQGLNPLNSEDVRKFWSKKGVGLNG